MPDQVQESTIPLTLPQLIALVLSIALLFIPIGLGLAVYVGDNNAVKIEQAKADQLKWAAMITLYDRNPVPAKTESSGDQSDER